MQTDNSNPLIYGKSQHMHIIDTNDPLTMSSHKSSEADVKDLLNLDEQFPSNKTSGKLDKVFQ